MADVLSTEQVEPRERLAYWREVICHTFIKLDVTQTQAGMFRGAVRTDQVGAVQVTRIRTDPMVAARSRRHLRAAEEERCLVALQLSGRTVGRQDGRDVVLEPGDLALFDSTRPYFVDFQGRAFDHLVLQFPRSVLADRAIDPSRATARRISAGSVFGRLVSPFLINVARVAAQTSLDTGERLGAMSLDLLAAALADASGTSYSAVPQSGDELLQRIKLYLHMHLSDPHLAPPAVAAAHNVSLRQLHRLFARDGTTFGRWLREERLRYCFDDLRAPQLAHCSVASVGARWGMPDAPGLSRAFRSRYGVSPSQHRLAALSDAAVQSRAALAGERR
ncbi:MAG: helix-turn-helix domain-containing protein [Actinomycetota bacterium]